MNLENIIVSFITSGIVSTTFGLIIRYHYKKKLEKFKANIEIKKGVEVNLTRKRLIIYPKIAELLYRIRNMAREIVTSFNLDSVIVTEIDNQKMVLIEYIYKNGLILQEDGLFNHIHRYKNILITFTEFVKDLQYFLKRKDEKEITNLKSKINLKYEEINSEYQNIIDSLKSAEKMVGDVK